MKQDSCDVINGNVWISHREQVPTTVIKFRHTDPQTNEIRTEDVVLVGVYDADNIDHRQIAYGKIADRFGEDFVSHCVIYHWEVFQDTNLNTNK